MSAGASTFPLSFAQERLWFLDQLAPGDPAFVVRTSLRLSAPIDPAVLQQALDDLVVRHESLRTRYEEEEAGQPVQIVAPALHVPLELRDLRALTPDDRAAEVDRQALAEARTPFDLRRLPLLRASLLVLGDADAVLSLAMHHIVADGWSLGLLFRDLDAFYLAQATGRPAALPALPIGYPDFAAWQRDRADEAEVLEQLDWWASALDGAPRLGLPTDHPRSPGHGGPGGVSSFSIPPGVAEAVLAHGRAAGCTPFMTLLAAFAVLLGRHAAQDDVVVGTYSAGRDRAELEQLVGFFVNTLALRCDLRGDPPFTVLLERVREAALDAFARQEPSFASIVRRLAPPRQDERNPLFDVVFHLYNAPGEELDAGSAATAAGERAAAALDLVWSMWQSGGGLHGQVEYRTALFEPETVAAIVRRFQVLLAGIAADPSLPVSALPLLPADEWQAEVVEANSTDRSWPDTTLIELFERQAAATPDAVAFVSGAESLTYAELRARALRLAARLRLAGAAPEIVVGIHAPRSLLVPVAVLGVLYTGAAFLPLDAGYPPRRLEDTLADGGARILLTSSPQSRLTRGDVRVVGLSDGDGSPLAGPIEPAAPHQLAYVIATSGSTGRPKCVAVEQRQVLNRLQWMWEAYPFAPGEVACQKTPFGFVDALWELLGGLLRGVPCVIASDEDVRDPERLLSLLGAHDVTRIWLVPSLLRRLLEVPNPAARAPRLRFWVVSGEPLPHGLAARFRARLPGAALFNLFGTSEVWDATWYDATQDEDAGAGQVPIGEPIANVQAYVVDERLQPVPRGTVGELLVGGAGVARGYLGTYAAGGAGFVADPFRPGGGRLASRTGDLARRRRDGRLELVGRRDHQLKVRGFRVEPGEVEATLLQHPAVRDAVVVARPGPGGEPILVGFLTGPAPGSLASVQSFLAARLPAHARPARLVGLPSLPTTPSGKVDRTALPDLAGASGPARPLREPRTALERLVAELWEEMLEVETLDLDDDFFADLGGHSLLAMGVVARVRRLLGMDVPVRLLFEAPTAARFADALASAGGAGAEETAAIVLRIAAMPDDPAIGTASVAAGGEA